MTLRVKESSSILILPGILLMVLLFTFCKTEDTRIRVIFDTDANNELDDQHALAYLLLNGDAFNVEGITVNTTRNGGGIDEQYAEAKRIMQLCNLYGKVPLLKGADGSFEAIRPDLGKEVFDGKAAIDFIIDQAKAPSKSKLILIPVGKLTNIALALEKAPEIANMVTVVWLGSNYPDPGEYNQINDVPAMNYVLSTDVPFEMVTVRYGKPSGTAAVMVTQEEINHKMPGLGPRASSPVMGRHEKSFETFGDYSVNLFEHIQYHGDPPSRSMFDLVAVAILKNPLWGESREIPCPVNIERTWIEQPDNPRKILIWENFDRDGIMDDFYFTLKNYVPVR